MENLRCKFEDVKDDETSKAELIEILSRKLTALEIENAMLKRDLKKTILFCDDFMADVKSGAAVISDLQIDIVDLLSKMLSEYPRRPQQESEIFDSSKPFVVVLIDGDRDMLNDADIQLGTAGGRNVAHQLLSHLRSRLVQRKVFNEDWRLILKFYASMSDPGTQYLADGIISHLSTWLQFIDGFNQADPYCYFVDSGDLRDIADDKIQRQIELDFGHRHCQHTILIGSEDSSYTGFLRRYNGPEEIYSRTTVIEAIPFPGEFHALAGRFLPIEKESLFKEKCQQRISHPGTPTKPSRTIPSGIPLALIPGPKPQTLPITPQNSRSRSPIRKPNLPQTSPRRRPPRTPSPRKIPKTASPTRRPFAAPRMHYSPIKRKPLAAAQPNIAQRRLPRAKNVFFSPSGQRIDSGSYVNLYSERYLQ